MKSKGVIAKNSFSFPDAKKMIVTFLFVLACTGYFQQGYGQETTNSKSTESEVKKCQHLPIYKTN